MGPSGPPFESLRWSQEVRRASLAESPEQLPRPLVLRLTCLILEGELSEPGGVHVVGKVCQLDAPRELVSGHALDEGHVARLAPMLTLLLGERLDCRDLHLGKPAADEHLARHAAVLHDVVEHGDALLFQGLEPGHDAERVEDVGGAGLVALAFVKQCGEGNGLLEVMSSPSGPRVTLERDACCLPSMPRKLD